MRQTSTFWSYMILERLMQSCFYLRSNFFNLHLIYWYMCTSSSSGSKISLVSVSCKRHLRSVIWIYLPYIWRFGFPLSSRLQRTGCNCTGTRILLLIYLLIKGTLVSILKVLGLVETGYHCLLPHPLKFIFQNYQWLNTMWPIIGKVSLNKQVQS